MPKIYFTEEEVRAALPVPREGRGLASRWEMFADKDPESKYARGDEAAQFVHDFLVKVLTIPGDAGGISIKLSDDLSMAVEDISYRYGSVVAGALREKFGENFGWNDTEPRYHLSRFFRRLFSIDRKPAF